MEAKMPAWTLLLSLFWCVIPLSILWACRDAGLSWWIGGPAAVVVAVGGVFLDRAIERKYRQKQRTN
ncbi:hypothetical protein SB768_30865 [Burkholderia sp. SIMBA_043]|uniref:hypothetical protein n=1 Tax=Burkholderia TaxID=32008 RepID=UPI0005EEBE5B|nr:hypothetical protein [Burkholderia vietnamiensis]AVR14817.1 hypothetical protein A8H33_15525 [Burkholderia vietnamiensis]KVE60755.1 hypothetical protein WI96_26385 [Burkholderia vietnamiensis]KVM58159.1 hypothetical protein WJ57_00020 [Burkholderia vietnamiensis]KVS07023.1 hypothetical protein WK30_03595 [Burkholderia vietnamiensis]UBI28823.1 hypothetical protein LA325_26685 [Burkholderia vietnamiensis]